jgi:murein DD-endopeptidase MepM/ murein hydrolase activator NlpD
LWYTSPVPLTPRNRRPGPLDSLPRPLSERGRPRGSRGGLGLIRFLLVVAVVVIVVVIAAIAVAPRLTGTVGAVAGAVGTPAPAGIDAVNGLESEGPTVLEATALPRPTLPPAAATPTPIPTPLPPALLTGYRWPLIHGRLTLPFGPTPFGSWLVNGALFHDGIDLATFCGDRIVAAHDGVVLAANRHFDKDLGWVGDLTPYFDRLTKKHLWQTLPIVIVVDDGNGYRSIYAHFSKVVVKAGDTIKAGQFIGYEGATGRATGCHVHYGLFSPLETATFGIEEKDVKRMKVPRAEIARIDPLLVMPPRTTPTEKPGPSASPTAQP